MSQHDEDVASYDQILKEYRQIQQQSPKHLSKDELIKEMQRQRDTMTASRDNVEVTEAKRNPGGSISMTVTVFERMFENESMFNHALQQAYVETVQRIASVILNERKADIEAACNFEDLRADLAAELARQFMAIRFSGQPANTNMSDAAVAKAPLTSQGGAVGYGSVSGGYPGPTYPNALGKP